MNENFIVVPYLINYKNAVVSDCSFVYCSIRQKLLKRFKLNVVQQLHLYLYVRRISYVQPG